MAHQIETNQITGKSEIAYVGKTPWHGLGQKLTEDAPIEVWRKEAGLDWQAKVSRVLYQPENEYIAQPVAGRNVVYRSDTFAPLGIVTDRYRVHQPDQILSFFDKLAKNAGFSLEVAGAINSGKRIWALAKTNQEACVMGDDWVKGYVLLSTSFDGSTATVGQFTSIRVVCNNTLSAADNEYAPSRVSITHGAHFDEQLMADKLGVMTENFEEMMARYQYLAHKSVTSEYVKSFLNEMFPPTMQQVRENNVKKLVLADSRSHKKVLELFDGLGMGSDFKGVSGTRWGLLNAVTQYVDHERGYNADNRLSNAWFGYGNRLKTEAEELLVGNLM